MASQSARDSDVLGELSAASDTGVLALKVDDGAGGAPCDDSPDELVVSGLSDLPCCFAASVWLV